MTHDVPRSTPLAAIGMALSLLVASCHGDTAGHDHGSSAPPAGAHATEASPDHLPAGVNAVQNEMRLLDAAMRDTVTRIAYGELRSIPASVHRVHQARALTEAAIEHGEYRPRKNAERMAQFRELDEAFHGDLEGLVEAASANDPDRTAARFGSVMARCNGCHATFRP